MLLKAGLIVAVFMHMLWERLALVYAIVVPPLLLLVLLGIGALEARLHFPYARPVLRRRRPARRRAMARPLAACSGGGAAKPGARGPPAWRTMPSFSASRQSQCGVGPRSAAHHRG